MCGIILISSAAPVSSFAVSADHLDTVNRRGPDFNCSKQGTLPPDPPPSISSSSLSSRQSESTCDKLYFYLHASVLHLRGPDLAEQPVEDPLSGSLLAWNGELFGHQCSDIRLGDSDTLIISEKLGSCSGNEEAIFRFFNNCEGPFAFAYCDRTSNTVYFGRDNCGRRSLTWTTTSHSGFILSSTLPPDAGGNDQTSYGEVSPHGMFSMQSLSGELVFTFHPWTCGWSDSRADNEADEDLQRFIGINRTLVSDSFLMPKTVNDNSFAQVEFPEFSTEMAPEVYLEELLKRERVLSLVLQFKEVLTKSIRLRCACIVPRCQNCTTPCKHAKIAVLFSGGIDSMVAAVLAHLCIPSGDHIDLLNVAFIPDNKPDLAGLAPDRKTGLSGYRSLLAQFPRDLWNMVAIDVAKSEVDQVRKSRLWQLIAPQSTVLDCSIATVLWFASRGSGNLVKDTKEAYSSPARVLLSGLGADELLGGYSRHRTKFRTGGEAGLKAEMEMDVRRIGSRNCGRDDRVISDHGREARYPFLDENVVNFLMRLPVRLRCRLDFPRRVGDKLLLRLLAWHLGLRDVAVLEKRAMQFGSRIAKIDQSKNGYDVMKRNTVT